MKQEYTWICPKCGEKEVIDIYPVINLQTDKELYEPLFSLELFKHECFKCHATSVIQYDLMVIDMYKNYIIYNTSNYKAINWDKILNSFKEDLTEIKHLRITTSLNELLEKLLIFDYDLNDYFIEQLKLGLSEDLQQDYPDIYFNKLDRDKLVFSCFNLDNKEIKPKNIEVSIIAYNKLIDLNKDETILKSDKMFKLIKRKHQF